MKFFNIDQHISVIADIKKIFGNLGHTVDDVCMSGHAFVMGKQPGNIPMLNGDNWCGFDERKDWERFYDTYAKDLEQYDAFVCCYPPIYSMLYKMFNKPIIIDIPIRYDYSVHQHINRLTKFNDYLIDGVDNGKIFLVANNKFDAEYCENFIGLTPKHIPSLCTYTGVKRTGYIPEFLYYSSFEHDYLNMIASKKERVLKAGYSWKDVAARKGIIHLPYQVSTMSIFEQYTMNMPLFFPTKEFMLELYKEGKVLNHYSPFLLAEGNHGCGSVIQGRNGLDPNNYKDIDSVKHWALEYSDYYDKEWMPHIQYFSSFKNLREMLFEVNLNDVSEKMEEANKTRKQQVYSRWEEVLKLVAEDI